MAAVLLVVLWAVGESRLLQLAPCRTQCKQRRLQHQLLVILSAGYQLSHVVMLLTVALVLELKPVLILPLGHLWAVG